MKSLLLLIAIISGPQSPFGEVVADEPGIAKAVIKARNGDAINPSGYKAGGVAIFSAKMSVYGDQPTSVMWEVEPEGLAQLCEEMILLDKDGGQNPCIMVPYGNDFAEFTVRLFVVKDNTGSRAKVDVKVGGGPRPPPVPPKPEPEPGPKPTPPPPPPIPTAKYLRLVVVEDNLNRKPETAATLNARKLWDGLAAKGHTFAVYAENDPTMAGKAAIDAVKAKLQITKFPQGGAYLIIQNKATSETLTILKLPSAEDTADMVTLFSGATP